MKWFTAISLTVVLIINTSTVAEAALVPLKGGALVHDVDRNLTYLANPNLPMTTTFGLAYINPSTGGMPYFVAQQFIEAMNSQAWLGVTTWRLPVSDDSCITQTNCFASELGHLFYEELGGEAEKNIYDSNTDPDLALFGGLIVNSSYYWTQTPAPLTTTVWGFSFSGGLQSPRHMNLNDHYVWPVFDGLPKSAGCLYLKVKATSQLAKAVAGCVGKYPDKDPAALEPCLEKAWNKFVVAWDKAESVALRDQLDCGSLTLAAFQELLEAELGPLVDDLLAGLDLGDPNARKTAKSLFKVVGGTLSGLLKAESGNLKKTDPVKLEAARMKLQVKFAAGWEKTLAKAQAGGVTYAGPMAGDVELAIEAIAEAVLGAFEN